MILPRHTAVLVSSRNASPREKGAFRYEAKEPKNGLVSVVIQQAPVGQKVDSAIHWINLYPMDNAINFYITYPLDSDLSGG